MSSGWTTTAPPWPPPSIGRTHGPSRWSFAPDIGQAHSDEGWRSVHSADVRPEDSIRVSRINRVFNEFVRPRRRGPSLSLRRGRLSCPGRAAPVLAGVRRRLRALRGRRILGTGVGHHVVPAPRSDSGGWAGREVALGFGIGNAGSTGFGAEALVWRQGRPVQGLSPNHREYVITPEAQGGEDIELFVEAAANPPSPFGANPWPMLLAEPHGPPLFTLQLADLHVRNPNSSASGTPSASWSN